MPIAVAARTPRCHGCDRPQYRNRGGGHSSTASWSCFRSGYRPAGDSQVRATMLG